MDAFEVKVLIRLAQIREEEERKLVEEVAMCRFQEEELLKLLSATSVEDLYKIFYYTLVPTECANKFCPSKTSKIVKFINLNECMRLQITNHNAPHLKNLIVNEKIIDSSYNIFQNQEVNNYFNRNVCNVDHLNKFISTFKGISEELNSREFNTNAKMCNLFIKDLHKKLIDKFENIKTAEELEAKRKDEEELEAKRKAEEELEAKRKAEEELEEIGRAHV
jgi:hypothetical protein